MPHPFSLPRLNFSFETSEVLCSCGGDLRLMLESQFSPAQLRCCGATAAALRACGCTVDQLNNAGFSLRELKIGGCSAAELRGLG
jgi:hypothetical protein